MKFYLSCRKEMPEAAIMDAELGVTMEDWAHIPTHEIPGLCVEARRQCHGFLPSNSLVAELWEEEKHRRFRAEQNRLLYLSPSEAAPEVKRTPEELAEIQKTFEEIRKMVGGAG